MISRAIRVWLGMGLIGLFAMAIQAEALTCGDTITTDTKLTKNLLNCSGNGLIIGASGITLNLNGKQITGQGNGDGIVVENVSDVVIRGGTVRNFGLLIFIRNSSNVRINHMSIRNADGTGIRIFGGSNVEVRRSRIQDLSFSGINVSNSPGFVLRNSRIINVGTGDGLNGCGGGNGVSVFLSDDAEILNNLFKRISRAGILFVASLDGSISFNTIIDTTSRPCSLDFGALSLDGGSDRTVVSRNRIERNHDFGIGLSNVRNAEIRRNGLRRNLGGFFLTRTLVNLILRRNCIAHSDTGRGLEVDPTQSTTYVVDALNNFWGATNGPFGEGPLGTDLDGRGEEILQKDIDNIMVIPFWERCR